MLAGGAGAARDRRRRARPRSGDAAAARTPARQARARRASSPPTTASTPAWPAAPPGADRLAAARRLAAATGAVVLLKGPLTAVADPGRGRGARRAPVRRRGPALATAGSGDVLSGDHRRLLARGLGALEAAALAAHVHGRAASLGPARGPRRRRPPRPAGATALGAGRRGRARRRRCPWLTARRPRCASCPRPPDDEAVTMAQGRSRPAWAEIDLAAVAHNAARAGPPGGAGRAVRGGQGPRLRARGAGGGAGRAGRRRDAARRRPGRRGGRAAPSTASRPRCSLLSECGPDAVETALAYGLTPTLYSAEAVARLRRRGRGRPGGARRST